MTEEKPISARRLTEPQRDLLAEPGARRLVARTVLATLRRFPYADPKEIEALANEALVFAALRYRPGAAQFATFAQTRVAGHVRRAITNDARALLRWLPPRTEGPSRATRPSYAPARWHRLAFDLFERNDGPLDPEATLIARVERSRVSGALRRALARLPAEQARLLRRRYVDGVDLPSLARESGCSVRTVSRRLAAIVLRLRQDLAASAIDGPAPEALAAA